MNANVARSYARTLARYWEKDDFIKNMNVINCSTTEMSGLLVHSILFKFDCIENVITIYFWKIERKIKAMDQFLYNKFNSCSNRIFWTLLIDAINVEIICVFYTCHNTDETIYENAQFITKRYWLYSNIILCQNLINYIEF